MPRGSGRRIYLLVAGLAASAGVASAEAQVQAVPADGQGAPLTPLTTPRVTVGQPTFGFCTDPRGCGSGFVDVTVPWTVTKAPQTTIESYKVTLELGRSDGSKQTTATSVDSKSFSATLRVGIGKDVTFTDFKVFVTTTFTSPATTGVEVSGTVPPPPPPPSGPPPETSPQRQTQPLHRRP